MDDIVLLQQKLDKHLSEYEMDRAADEKRWSNLIKVQETNTHSIQQLADSTHEIVAIYRATDGTIKMFGTIGRFARWVGGFTALALVIKWLSEHLSPPS